MDLSHEPGKRVAVIVAHPDDETLWAGGLLLMHPEWSTFILSMSHGDDPVRGPRFRRMLERQGAQGAMGKTEDLGREDARPERELEDLILALLPSHAFDLILTHGPHGEYTEHVLHEEVSESVDFLLEEGELKASALWQFAYEDEGGRILPRAAADATCRLALDEEVWVAKRSIITDIYGFSPDAWETRVTPRVEGFRCRKPPAPER